MYTGYSNRATILVASCATDEIKLRLSPSAKRCQNPCSTPPPVYQDLSTCRDWPVEKATVDLPIRLKGNLNLISGNSLSPLGAQNKDFSAILQPLLTKV